MATTPPDDADNDDLLAQIGQMGAALNEAKNPALDPELRALAQRAGEDAAAKLPKN